jgi:pimeloyl-ACP methyl ester carboxylesterase
MPYLNLEDADIYYETHGEGRPFLFCAATATHGRVWEKHQVPEFARDHKVIIYDQRWTGRSKARSENVSTKRLADDAIALLNEVGGLPAIVLGHSMGGRIAQLMALDHPDKVFRLILASTGASFPTRGVPIKMCLRLVEKGYERYVHDNSMKAGFTEKFVRDNKQAVDEFMAVRLSDPPPLDAFLRFVVARQETDTSDRLGDIHTPTLVLAGDAEHEPDASGITHFASSKFLADSIPGAKFVVLAGQAHYYPFVDAANMHAAIRKFLAQ